MCEMRRELPSVRWWYTVPCLYWVRTRLADRGELLKNASALLGYFAVLFITLLSLGTVSSTQLGQFTLGWIIFIGVYEVGYLINDHWKSRARRGQNERSPHRYLERREAFLLLIAVVIRIIFGAGLTVTVSVLVDNWPLSAFLSVIAISQIFFLVHNLVGPPLQYLSHLGLHTTKYAIALPFLGLDFFSLSLLIAIAPAVGNSFVYSVKKHGRRNGVEYLEQISYNVGLSIATLILSLGAVVDVAISPGVSPPLVAAASYFLVLNTGWIGVRWLLSYEWDRGELRHVHTERSHDASLSVDEIQEHAQESNLTRVYITDHAEDLTPEEFTNLQEELHKRSNGDLRLIPGLEYDIEGHHVLAFGLDSHDGPLTGWSDLAELEDKAEEIAWAHPIFSFRRLAKDKSYWGDLLRRMHSLPGFEIINRKSRKASYWRWGIRHLIVGLGSVALFGMRRLYTGADAHDRVDFSDGH